MNSQRPVLVIPMGDPNGIGPEIIVKALSDPDIWRRCRPLVTGDRLILEQAARWCGLDVSFNLIRHRDDLLTPEDHPGKILLADSGHDALETLHVGRVQALAGQYAYDYIVEAVDLIQRGIADAMVTTPINKESLRAAAIPYIGHTEILAGLTQCDRPLTLFETDGLRVFFLSRHVSLRQACDLVTRDRVSEMIQASLSALKELGLPEGMLAVAGLNPHSGEHGLFGDEEMTAVEPAIRDCQAQGLSVTGPIGADSVFHQAHQGRYAAVLSLYHDQGHIATKTLDFERTIALTLGLPFLRTSVDHGTALDIAGQGVASAVSLKEALRLGTKYCQPYRQNHTERRQEKAGEASND